MYPDESATTFPWQKLVASAKPYEKDPEDAVLLDSRRRKVKTKRWIFELTAATIISTILIVLCLAEGVVLIRFRNELHSALPQYSSNGLSLARDQPRLAHMPSKFFNGNEAGEDESWEAIEAGHGLVSVPPEYAAARGLPDSLVHPHDPKLRVYVIEAYHSIHCLQNLRRHYMNIRRGEKPDRPLEHDLHCFDSLRQSIMCQANDDLLWTTGHSDAGVNQTRQCRSWDGLREFATKYTSCYHDYTAPPGETRWGKCDHGVDGLPYNSLL